MTKTQTAKQTTRIIYGMYRIKNIIERVLRPFIANYVIVNGPQLVPVISSTSCTTGGKLLSESFIN